MLNQNISQDRIMHVLPRLFICILVLISLFLTSFNSYSQVKNFDSSSNNKISKAVFVSDEWHDLTRKDGTGLYFDLVKSVYARRNIEVEFKIFPYARAVQKVKDMQADGWVASFLNEKNFPIYPKYHFDKNEQIIIYKRSSHLKNVSIDSLKDKRVAWLRDFGLDRFIKVPMKITEIDSIDSAFLMLERNRIDFFVGAKSDIEDYIKSSSQDMKNFGSAYALHLGLYMAYANNERGKKLKEIWDEEMEKFHLSEDFKNIYKKYGYNYPFP